MALQRLERIISDAAATGTVVQDGAGENGTSELEQRVITALKTVYDPELPVNIYDLGLIYALRVDPGSGEVAIRMTLTAPGCPVAQSFPATVTQAVEAVAGVRRVRVELVWEPPWSRERMSRQARYATGLW